MKEPSIAFLPVNDYILNLSKSFTCTMCVLSHFLNDSYTSAMEEVFSESIPVPDETVRIVTRQLSADSCLMYMLLRYNTQHGLPSRLYRRYKAVLVEGTLSEKPSAHISILPIPVEERNTPIDILFSPSSCLFSFFFRNGALRQFALRKDATTGEYSLHFQQSIPLLTSSLPTPASKRAETTAKRAETTSPADDSAVVTWRPWLTEVTAKAFAFVSFAKNAWRLCVLQAEYLNELCSLPLEGEPTALAVGKATLAVAVGRSVSVAGFQRSTLTLASILRGGKANGTPARQSALHSVQSRVTTGAALLSGLETGVLGEAEWAARKPAADPSEAEEEALLAAEDFEAAALAFIAQRVTANSGVISLRNAFLMRLTERCVQDPPKEEEEKEKEEEKKGKKGKKSKKGKKEKEEKEEKEEEKEEKKEEEKKDEKKEEEKKEEKKEPVVLSSVLRALLRHSVDIAMNPHVLPRLMAANDITTLLLYLKQAPAVPEANLLTLAVYFLGLEDAAVQRFATEYGWETGKGDEALRLLLLAGRFLLRVNAKSGALRQCMRELNTDTAYNVALLLTVGVGRRGEV